MPSNIAETMSRLICAETCAPLWYTSWPSCQHTFTTKKGIGLSTEYGPLRLDCNIWNKDQLEEKTTCLCQDVKYNFCVN